jgi:hypothetical protein
MGYVKRSIVKSSIPSSPLKAVAAVEVAQVAEPEVVHEPVGCMTPKAKKHRIPVVDVDLCPGAPKKPRRCNGSSNFIQKLSFTPNYLF